jgi:Transglutaminase-like superfamily
MSITFEAYRELLVLEYPLYRRDFAAIHERVRQTVLGNPRKVGYKTTEICRAVDLAAVFYFHKVLCLQRSAAAVCLLKKYGFAAQLVIGVQHLPFAAHAWVELDGAVVNDKSYMPEMYSILERC